MTCVGDPFEIRQGDRLPFYRARALATNPATGMVGPVDFTLWTDVTFRMAGPRTIEGPASADAAGWITYVWHVADTNAPGTYVVSVTGTSPDGLTQTFPLNPTRDPATVVIIPR